MLVWKLYVLFMIFINYRLNVLEKNSFDSWQYKKVCPIESGLKQKRHLSSANLYLSSSFFVAITLYTTLKVNCLSLLSFEDLHIFVHKTISPIRKFWKAFFPSLYCAGFWNKFLDEQTVTIFSAEFGSDYCSIFHCILS